MLQDIKQDCLNYANLLPKKYEDYSIDELADGYCKACDEKNEYDKNIYFSALILRFWYAINKIAMKSPGMTHEYEEFFFWLAESIQYACKYRAWQDPEKKVNAQQAINQCIETIRLQYYYQANLDKHKANFNTTSLDAPFGSIEETEKYSLDFLANESESPDQDYLDTESIIQSFINNKRLVEAIIFDTIAFNDCHKHTRKVVKESDSKGKTRNITHTYSEFWPYRVVQILSKLPTDYTDYFSDKYKIVTEELQAALDAVKKASNQKLYAYVQKSIKTLRVVMTGTSDTIIKKR